MLITAKIPFILFLNPQITYMIFIYSRSLKQNIVLEDNTLECVSIGCHKTRPKVITTINQSKGKHHTIQWKPEEKTRTTLFRENASQLRLVLVLNMHDWWIGMSFLDQSQSDVKSGLLSTFNLMSSKSLRFSDILTSLAKFFISKLSDVTFSRYCCYSIIIDLNKDTWKRCE